MKRAPVLVVSLLSQLDIHDSRMEICVGARVCACARVCVDARVCVGVRLYTSLRLCAPF